MWPNEIGPFLSVALAFLQKCTVRFKSYFIVLLNVFPWYIKAFVTWDVLNRSSHQLNILSGNWTFFHKIIVFFWRYIGIIFQMKTPPESEIETNKRTNKQTESVSSRNIHFLESHLSVFLAPRKWWLLKKIQKV